MSIETTKHEEKPLLIKTNTCPACRAAVAILDGAGIEYEVLTDSDEGYADATEMYGVRHVPTLILRSVAGWRAMTGTDAIRDFAKSHI